MMCSSSTVTKSVHLQFPAVRQQDKEEVMEQWEVGEVMEQQEALQVKKKKNESLLKTNSHVLSPVIH